MRKHTGETPFQCKICNKKFSQRANLSKHEKIHKNQREHQCKFCGKTFFERYYLQVRQLTVLTHSRKSI